MSLSLRLHKNYLY